MLGQAGGWAGFRFSDEATHAATHFKKLGYETMLLGLAHEVAGSACPDSYFDKIGFDILWHDRKYFSRHARELKEKMPAILDVRKDIHKPFYLQIGIQETHTPYLCDGVEPFEEFGVTIPESPALCDGLGTRRQFAELQGAVNRLDEGLGHVMKCLEERGLSENTILVFTADHGLPMPREKTTLYDRGIGVFLMIRYPGIFPKGARYDHLVSNIDILPTLIEAVGGNPPENIEGKSFFPLLTGSEYDQRKMLFAEKTFHTSYDPVRCVRTKDFKYIFNFESVRPENYCLDIYNKPVLIENRASLRYRPDRFDELYDLKNDPNETANLAEDPKYQDVRKKLASELVKWMTATDDPILEGPVASPKFYEKISWLKNKWERTNAIRQSGAEIV